MEEEVDPIQPKIIRIAVEDREQDDRVSETNKEKGYLTERYIAEKISEEYNMGYKESAYQPMVNDAVKEMDGERFTLGDTEYIVETERESGPGPNDRNLVRVMEVAQ